MAVRLCRQCKGKAEGDLLQMIVALAKKGRWLCPFGKPACGKVH